MMNNNTEFEGPGIQLLADFRHDLTGAPADATDRMRHSILNGSQYRRPAVKSWFLRGPAVATAAAALAALVAGGVALSTVDHGPGQLGGAGAPSGDSTGPTHSGSSPLQLRDVAYVRAQTLAALGDLDQYVLKMHAVGSSGTYDTWTDRQTSRQRSDMYSSGSLYSSAITIVADGKSTGIRVQWRTRAYDELEDPAQDTTAAAPFPADPAIIKSLLDKGRLEIVGQEQVDGHDTVHLRLTGGATDYTLDLWVDTTSFQPYKTVGETKGHATAHTEVTTFEWLPRTDENLSHFDRTPPPGFTKNGSGTVSGSDNQARTDNG